MLTRCPACHTRFRLHPAQLHAAKGRVRCGRCGHAFDARSPAGPLGPGTVLIQETATSLPNTSAQPGGTGTLARLLWSLGVLTLVASLALQYAWWDRHRLATHPEGQRILQHLCRYVPCDVEPPSHPDRIEVLERSLVPDSERPDALRFSLRMVNQAAQAQPFPLIELRLFDSRQQLIAARRFAPEHYRRHPANAWDLMPPAEPMEIVLTLQDPGTHITGFRLDFL